jgi:Protein of unknown function (DUF3168)
MASINIETQLQAVLQTLCPRVYPDVAPDDVATPYVVWHMYGGQAVAYVNGSQAARRNAYVQVNVWGASRGECNSLSLDIAKTLTDDAATPNGMAAVAISELMGAFDKDTELRGSMQDFSLWGDR